ncbi:MAG TPA: hypothetical protein VF290_06355 [Pyrinomonadaceae bacterium]
MTRVRRGVGAFVLMVVAALSVSSQETQPSHSTQQTTTQSTNQTTNQTANFDYVFPTPEERFKRYVKATVGPTRLAFTAASAGINQWTNSPEEWEQGAKGYGRRFASGMGENAIRQTVIYGLDSAMGLDTGFERSKREGFLPRLKDALVQNVTSRTRSGNRVISVPRLAGVYTGAIVSRETWYPERYSYKDGLRSGTKSLLTGFGINLVREFVINW